MQTNSLGATTPTADKHLLQETFISFPAAAGLDFSTELIVRTLPDIRIAEYQGTRATLEAEVVIPAGTKWPEGFNDLHWEDDKFRYWLCRKRPEGIKGPRKSFLNFDWWRFRCEPIKHKSWDALAIERKLKDLADEVHRQSAKGRVEWNKQWNAFRAAQNDEKFQAFKAAIPGINRPKRGRRPQNVEQSQGASV